MAPVSPYRSFRNMVADAWRQRALSVKALSFGLIGVVNTAVDWGVFLAARAVLERSAMALGAFTSLANYCHCGAPATLLLICANVMSWSVAVTGSYVLNSSITFAAESGRQLRWRDYAIFVGSGIFGLLANTATLIFVAQVLLLPVWLAKGFAILASFVLNFSLSHFVVFRVRARDDSSMSDGPCV